jgi:hypothetical protein
MDIDIGLVISIGLSLIILLYRSIAVKVSVLEIFLCQRRRVESKLERWSTAILIFVSEGGAYTIVPHVVGTHLDYPEQIYYGQALIHRLLNIWRQF